MLFKFNRLHPPYPLTTKGQKRAVSRPEIYPMAELHVIGEILDAVGFAEDGLSCVWALKYGGGWRVLEGSMSGQTQIAFSSASINATFAHPIDIHLCTKSIQGWPKLQFHVWSSDSVGRMRIAGYGFCHVPTFPGEHMIECAMWRPLGSAEQELRRWVLGSGIQVVDTDVISAPFDRCRLNTVSVGKLRLRLAIILRHFDKFDVEY
ncbi:B9 domain-containing protein 2 [Trichinella nativa]|uniref:B9 domain-containing protein 2 n=3 Tax=Trichinella TaxID=6333 RepID=A0A0V1L0E8_9BILA|nr:B9 domain-containing protein 2 [Trichinella murrelli]KRX71704.1 B9 domain-containing protein 2 [Trichinella sp. T6]KRY21817.1 B9 domain-containing protein 2 [Trichinella patagoniensis]KRZ53016.1 B9 domain-containing protein 2 [Trichinella nativa]KRZ83701.1 B9 domain-containing protein 2 [Trichinella sp. T8]